MTSIEVSPFIPQRSPMILVDHILYCTTDTAMTDFVISSDHIFVKDSQLTAIGLLENMAQTCAARIGYLDQSKEIKIGVIGNIKHCEIIRLPRINEKIQTTITLDTEFVNAVVVHAKIQCE